MVFQCPQFDLVPMIIDFFVFFKKKDFYSWIYILCFGQWLIDAEDDDDEM